MIQLGKNYRYMHTFAEEVAFCRAHGFELMQLWFDKNGLCQNKDETGNLNIIRDQGFPVIIHALIDINQFESFSEKLLPILDRLEQNELIIHPTCKSEPITDRTIVKLTDRICNAEEVFTSHGVQLYIENNSKLDPILNLAEDLEYLFKQNDKIQFLLDLAHMNDYSHLKDLVQIKYPSILHIADRNLANIHEHLPLGQGNINFKKIFSEILPDYQGRIIFELMYSDQELHDSRQRLMESIGISEG